MNAGNESTRVALRIAIVAARPSAARLRLLVSEAAVAISVTACDSMQSALAHLAEAPCDAALIDMDLACEPDMLARLREAAPATALIAVVGDAQANVREQALALGAHECLGADELRPDLLGFALRHAVVRAQRRRGVHEHVQALRRLFDFSPQPMWMFDASNLRFLAVNRAAIDVYGYTDSEFLAMTLADLCVSAQAGRVDADANAIGRHRKKNGSQIEVEIFAQRVPQLGDGICLGQARDVTAERRAMRTLEASERRFRDLFQHSTGFICIHDLDGTLLSVNPAIATALGRSVAELLGTPLRNLSAPPLRFLVDNYLQRVIGNGEDAGLLRVLDADGAELVWQYRNRVYADADGVSYVMGYAQDITAMRAVEHAFKLSEQRLRTIADTLPLKIAYVDAQQRLVFANEAFRRAYAVVDEDVAGLHVRDLLGAVQYARRQPYLERALSGERVVFEDEDGDGDDYQCVEVTFIPETAEKDASVIGVHVMVQDVTSKKREEKRLIRLARIDPLTGLMNRAAFYDRLDNALARARDVASLLAVFYVDIDHFKQVNDTHGHAIGDALIRAFATRLGEKVRASDAVARLGGDEFTVVMEGVPDTARVRTIAAKLIAAMSAPFELSAEGVTLAVGASIGIAACRGGLLAAPALVARADAMLYEAKQGGRGTWRIETIGVDADPARQTGADELES